MSDDIDRLADDGCPHACLELDECEPDEAVYLWTDCDYED